MLASRICLLLSFCAVGSTKAQAATYSLYKNDYYCINTECLWYGSDGKTVEECASAVVVDGNCSGTFYGKEGHCFCVRQGATCVEAQSSSGNSIYRTPKEAISTALSTTTGATALPPATEAISTALSTTTGATALPPTTEAYCGYEKCAWTFDWSCPGQDLGRNGTARDDGTDGYKCCCKDELWRQAEEASCSDETCAWTLDWSCPGQDLGRIGAAKDDGTMGYKCCCKEGLWYTAVQAKMQEAISTALSTTTGATALPPTTEGCSTADTDRNFPRLAGCCNGLTECVEDRPNNNDVYCAASAPGHGSTCWSQIVMCRTTCQPRQGCSTAGNERYFPDLGGCCSGLTECVEERPTHHSGYCAASDPGHGSTCWSTIVNCRTNCQALSTTTMEQLATPTESSIAKSDGNRRLFSNGFILV